MGVNDKLCVTDTEAVGVRETRDSDNANDCVVDVVAEPVDELLFDNEVDVEDDTEREWDAEASCV